MQCWRRSLVILRRLAPFAVAFSRDRRSLLVWGRPRQATAAEHVRRADELSATIASLGPAFIKLAQVFSARPDLVPEPYLSAIARLQDRCPPEPWPAIEAVLRAELGADAGALVGAMDPVPVAAASLGQVHRARLSGGDVAVKVLRPRVEGIVALDLAISARLLGLLRLLFPGHRVRDVEAVVHEFGRRIHEEMDFRLEAAHSERFRRSLAVGSVVRTPQVLEAYTRRRVLVTAWVDGDKVDALGERFTAGRLDFDGLMRTLGETYLRMMLVDGVVHADPHAGNLLVDADGAVVFLDWGMVVQLDEPTRHHLIRTALAVSREDLDGVLAGMAGLGMIDHAVPLDEVREAAGEIMAIVARARDVGRRRMQRMIEEILETFRTWPLILPPRLVYFFRALALVEGVGFRYRQDFDGHALARSLIAGMRGELMLPLLRPQAATARRFVDRAGGALLALPQLVERLETERLRVRMHPADSSRIESFVLLQTRRVMLGMFALGAAVIASIVFLRLGSVPFLLAGFAFSFVAFMLTLLAPDAAIGRRRAGAAAGRARAVLDELPRALPDAS